MPLNIHPSFFRKSSTKKLDPSTVTKNQPDLKRKKTVQGQGSVDQVKQGTTKMIELDIFDSDEEP